MTASLIAIAIQDDNTISPHAGRAQHWEVYDVQPDQEPVLAWTLNLTETGCLHEWHVRGDGNRHPLHSVDVAIAGSGGEGVRNRLAERDTQLVTTTETSPQKALSDFVNDTLEPGLPHDEQSCLKTSTG